MDLNATLTTIQATAVKAAGATTLEVKDPRSFLVIHNGEQTERAIPPPLRSHTVQTLRDLAGLAVAAADKQLRPEDSGRVSVWHDTDRVQVLADDLDRRERITLPLVKTTAWLAAELLPTKIWQQDELIRLCRLDLAGFVPADLLTALRSIKFRKGIEASSDLAHQTHSLGNSVEMECIGAEEIPEQFEINTAVYANVDGLPAVTIMAAIEIVHAKQGFKIGIVGDGLQRVMRETQEVLHGLLTEAIEGMANGETPDIAIYHGTP